MNTIKANLTLIDVVNYLIGDELKLVAQEQVPTRLRSKKRSVSVLQVLPTTGVTMFRRI